MTGDNHFATETVIQQVHLFFLYKQPVYKQLGLDLQKVKQLTQTCHHKQLRK